MKSNPKSTRPEPLRKPAGQPSSGVIDPGQTGHLSDQAKVLESVVDCLPDGVIVADRSGTLLIFNTAARQILGLVPPRAQPTVARTSCFHLSDSITSYPTDQLPLARALQGETVNAVEIFIRNQHVPDGRWINANALPWRDQTGTIHGALLIIRDVGEERESRALNERLSNVVEQTADSVLITDSKGMIVYVNPAFEQTTGYARDEAIGRTPRLLRSGQHDRQFYKRLWDTVLAGGVFRGTLINQKKNGEIFHAEQTISPIAGADGRCEYLVSVAKDITERLQNERQQVQLDAAHAIQQRLYPRAAPQILGFDFAGAAHPADSLCGDYYDFIPMPGGSLGMTVADVCGHGVGPSILMAQARAYLRSLALVHADVGEVLYRLNEILTVEGSEREFVTQILVRLDPDARTLVYANAGHPAGLLLDRDGQLREELGSCGPPLGILTDRKYPSSQVIQLKPGDVLALFTDGITECTGPTESEFGTTRVLELVRSHRHDAADAILKALFTAASSFQSDGPQVDDMTAIVCKLEE